MTYSTGLYMKWLPHVTVATVIEQDDRYLLVEEIDNGRLVFNQPAGHLDANETLQQAAIRETYEETGWTIELNGIVGMALYTSQQNQITYCRTTFYATACGHNPDQPLDKGIQRALWLSYEEMLANTDKMRSPLVIKSVQQYREGHRYPLAVIFP
jgi:ADP-ribose pyrophosphatase YjhB (NUDIX family)